MLPRAALSELLAAGVLLRPAEAAAIVAEVCARITRGELRGVPSVHVLRVSPAGELFAEGPVTAHRATVSRAAQLLDDLLAPADSAPEFRAPGPLRLVLLRARGGVDLPPFPGLDSFAAAIARFVADDRAAVLRELYARAQRAIPETAPNAPPSTEPAAVLPVRATGSELRELTISDIRRARRATGMTLRDVSERSRIPPALLRELEWGYLWNWPGGLYGRSQLVRYARAANLEERLVMDVIWPMLQTVVDARGGDAVRLIPAEESIDVLVPLDAGSGGTPAVRSISTDAEVPRRRGAGFMLAAAAAAALVISPAAFWLRSHENVASPSTTVALNPTEDVALPRPNPEADAAPRAESKTAEPVRPRDTESRRDAVDLAPRPVPVSVSGPEF